MASRFFLITNSLRDLRGHYFETSVSICQAARELHLVPVLGVHADCQLGIFPPGIDAVPIFCTDHWMGGPPADPPAFDDEGISVYQAHRVAAADVRAGRASVRDYVDAHFGAQRDAAPPLAPLRERAHLPRTGNSADRLWAWYWRAAWLLERAIYYSLPHFAYRGLLRCVPYVLTDEGLRQLGSGLRRNLLATRRPRPAERFAPTPVPAASAAAPDDIPPPPNAPALLRTAWLDPLDGPIVRAAYQAACAAGVGHEIYNGLIFKRDLERLFHLASVAPDDHVLLGTAHGRELFAIHLFMRRMGVEHCPTFHLEYRHPLFDGPPSAAQFSESPRVAGQRVFFDLYRTWEKSDKIRFYTDTPRLSREYEVVAEEPFDVLPIPFRAGLIRPSPRRPGQPLTLAFFGDARDEKGIHWLPDLIEELMRGYLKRGRVRFLVQATPADPRYNHRSQAALAKLRAYPRELVTLVGEDGPLTPEAYYDLVSRCDLGLFPYDADRYRAASSGTLAEAVAAGRPTIVPAETWLAEQVGPDAGESFTDLPSFIRAVRRVIDNYDAYRRAAVEHSARWLAIHSPHNLVQTIVGSPATATPSDHASPWPQSLAARFEFTAPPKPDGRSNGNGADGHAASAPPTSVDRLARAWAADPRAARVVHAHCHAGDTVFDFGSTPSELVELIVDRVGPLGGLFLFRPDGPARSDLLPAAGVTWVATRVGATSRAVPVAVARDAWTDGPRTAPPVQVERGTLDELHRAGCRPRLVRIALPAAHAAELLAGAAELLLAARPVVWLEANQLDAATRASIECQLQRLDYRVAPRDADADSAGAALLALPAPRGNGNDRGSA
ncbi:MAG: hypothetical protein U1A27_04620 [Phycisphaerae bacterium]